MKRWTIAVLTMMLAAGVMWRLAGQEPSPEPPPGVVPASATLEPLAGWVAGGNAVLRVRFEEGTELPPSIPYETENGTVVLADDGKGFDKVAGDGLYTALGSMDIEAARERLARLAESKTAMPVSAWRDRSRFPVDARPPRALEPGVQVPWELWGDPADVSASHSLMITDLGVVEDPTRTSAACGQPSKGPWSFGYLMEQMANTPVTGVSGSQFARVWLDRWMSAQVVNYWHVRPRALMQTEIIDPWIAASGGPGSPLDLSKAPFKLLAIVNRVDLRDQAVYGVGSGGELRFVFMHVRNGCASPTSVPFQVILEFGAPASSCANVKAWARQWKALDTLPLGSPAYNAALEAITRQVVVANAASGRPNGSALNRIRTNETRLSSGNYLGEWELREFQIDPTSHLLVQATLGTQTPTHHPWYDFGDAQDYIDNASSRIRRGTHVVPLRNYSSFYGDSVAFRGASFFYSHFSFWDGPHAWGSRGFVPQPGPVDREARHLFSLKTCNGCHSGETNTTFSHVGVAPFGTEAPLSTFLTGGSVVDPADGTPTRYFNDLERRAVDMDGLLHTQCLLSALDLPLLAASH